MPFYDLCCADCSKEFNVGASISDRTEKRIVCPKCGSNDLKAVFKSANFYVKMDKESECPNSHICGSGCCHAHNG